MKRYLPFVVAFVLFLLGVGLASGIALTAPSETVVVAAADLAAGHVLTEADVTTAKVSSPPADAFTDPAEVVGQTLAVPRMAGDVITAAALGGLPDLAERLAPNERAVAVRVSRSSGLAGLLRPGDRVGITMVLSQGVGEGSAGAVYAKAVVENLRVIYVSPDFQASELVTPNQDEDELGLGNMSMGGSDQGVVVVAVPIEAQAVVYDFSVWGLPKEARAVNAVELLSALDQSNARLSLYLTPREAKPLASTGLFLADLVVVPSPTPTPGPGTPTPTPTP